MEKINDLTLDPLHFVVVDEQLVEDSLEAGLPVLLMHTSSGKSAAKVALRFGLAFQMLSKVIYITPAMTEIEEVG